MVRKNWQIFVIQRLNCLLDLTVSALGGTLSPPHPMVFPPVVWRVVVDVPVPIIIVVEVEVEVQVQVVVMILVVLVLRSSNNSSSTTRSTTTSSITTWGP